MNRPRLPEPEDRAAALLAMGVAQLVGTLLGFLIGLIGCALTAYLLVRRIGWTKLEPIFRLEFSDAALSLVNQSGLPRAISSGRSDSSTCGNEHDEPAASDRQQSTNVADFADQQWPLPSPEGTYYEQQQRKAEQELEQEKEILRKVLEDNLILHQAISGLSPAA